MNTPTMQLLEWADRQGPWTAQRIGHALLIAQQAHRHQYRRNGDPYIEHPVAVALILTRNDADPDTVVTAVLHDVLDEPTPIPLDRVRGQFGDVVADLLVAFTELDNSPTPPTDAALAVDTFDRRVLQLKVADRLHNMRTIGCLEPDKQCRKANQTREVVAPVARAVGFADLAHELDALATATLHAHTPVPPQRRSRRHRSSLAAVDTLHRALCVGAALLPPHHRDRLLQDWEGELHAAASLAERIHFTSSVLLHLPHLALITRRMDRP